MNASTLIALSCCLVVLTQAENPPLLPAFAIYRAVDASAPEARAFTFKSPDDTPVNGHYDPKPIVILKDVFEFKAATTEYGAAPAPGLAVRFTNEGNRAVAAATTKQDETRYVIFADGQPVGQIVGRELWRIGTLRLQMLITFSKKSGTLNQTIALSVNEAKKAKAP